MDTNKPDTQEPPKKTVTEQIKPKSIRQIVEEAHKPVEVKPEVKEEVKPDKLEEDVVEKKKERAKQKEEERTKQVEDIAKKTSEETATKVAEEMKKEFQAEIDKILQKPIDDQAKQKEADELVASWEKEKRLPKDYPELIKETQRIAEVKAKRTMEEMLAKRDEEVKAQREKEETEKKTAEEAKTKQVEDFNKKIKDELEELHAAKILERPSKPEEIDNPNTTDKAAKEVQKFFEYGIKYNKEQVSKGLQPETSLTKLYFLHYKPEVDAHPEVKEDKQPAGANAPIAGNPSVPLNEAPPDRYIYARDHNKSWDQLKDEISKVFHRS
jgi:hypothetical protein